MILSVKKSHLWKTWWISVDNYFDFFIVIVQNAHS